MGQPKINPLLVVIRLGGAAQALLILLKPLVLSGVPPLLASKPLATLRQPGLLLLRPSLKPLRSALHTAFVHSLVILLLSHG